MKIGIIGSGPVGQALGTGFAQHGHTVMLGTRDPSSEKVQEWVKATGNSVTTGTFAETAAFGEVGVVATGWTGTENALRLAGPENLAGKAVIDVTNPLDFSTGAPKLAVGFDDSGGEQVQRWLPGAKVVKAFNIITASAMVDPKFEDGEPDMFIAGDDEGAKGIVTGFLTDFGWRNVVDLGGIDAARMIEPLGMIWIVYGFRTGTWTHAIKLLRK